LITFTGSLTGSTASLINVHVTSAAGLGTGVVGYEGGTEVSNGAQLQLERGITVAGEPLILQGTGSQSQVFALDLSQLTVGNTVATSNVITGLTTSTSNLSVGESVSGTGIPAGATIATITPATQQITLSVNATATGATALTFGGAANTFDLAFNGVVTAPLAFTGNAATDMSAIQNALNGLSSLPTLNGSAAVNQ